MNNANIFFDNYKTSTFLDIALASSIIICKIHDKLVSKCKISNPHAFPHFYCISLFESCLTLILTAHYSYLNTNLMKTCLRQLLKNIEILKTQCWVFNNIQILTDFLEEIVKRNNEFFCQPEAFNFFQVFHAQSLKVMKSAWSDNYSTLPNIHHNVNNISQENISNQYEENYVAAGPIDTKFSLGNVDEKERQRLLSFLFKSKRIYQ